jgi:catechol 2,3-dioxygenase-like lactoylglutathione lyase family enzyme
MHQKEGKEILNESRVFATLAVNDIAAGKQFYGGTLGLKQVDENEGGVTYESGGGRLFVYVSPTAGKGQATCAFWEVSDVQKVIEDLKGKGIAFEHYDMPGATWEGDAMVMGGEKVAWFKDADGNILGVGQKA